MAAEQNDRLISQPLFQLETVDYKSGDHQILITINR